MLGGAVGWGMSRSRPEFACLTRARQAAMSIQWTGQPQSASRKQRRHLKSRARVYADVNVNRPKEYYNYEALNLTWGYANA